MRLGDVLRVAVASVTVLSCGGKASTEAGTDPRVTNRPSPVSHVMLGKVSKIDLLFMIDNSSSMADKQELLALTVPDLVGRLVNPLCVDRITHEQVGVRLPDGSCAAGERDFEPVKDIHIGIISSSLGGHGAMGVCDQPDSRKTFPHNDDRAHLLARGPMDAAVTPMGGKAFLNWNPTGGNSDPSALVMPFVTMVTGVGQHGCGYEAPLEAIYRFLIDPEPYDTITIDKTPGYLGAAVLNGTDTALLQQRRDFLRPDSLVAVVMMTDENDCSIIDGGQNFYALAPPSGSPAKSILTHGTSACLSNPNDRCCYSCLQVQPDGCPAPDGDPECSLGPWLKTEDPENLRCFEQKRRYGIDFLHPVKRYIDGFTSHQVIKRDGTAVKNPLFDDLQCVNGQGCAAERDKTYVFVAGILGVPWQDIANDPNDLGKGYKTAKQINDESLWAKILGSPQPADKSPPVLPTDIHMIESVTPRAGLASPDSPVNADPIHGHEWDTSKDSPSSRDLQYACTFPLPLGNQRSCTDSTDCDCANPIGGMVADLKNPLCQGANGYSTTQVRAKAYPGIRELQVLQGLNDQTIVTSICPANVTDMTRSDFGYRPAIAALIGRFRNALRGRCLPRALTVDPTTKLVACTIIEVFNPPPGAACDCPEFAGRAPAPDAILTAEMKSAGSCRCQMHQLSDATDFQAATICQTEVTPPPMLPNGWCYVDPAQHGAAACPLVRDCPPTDERILRFVSPQSEPRPGASVFLSCEPELSFPTPSPSVCNP